MGKEEPRTRDEDESSGTCIECMAPVYSVGPRIHLRTASAVSEMD